MIIDQLNRPIHDLRISVIDRCNFRCPYCMPEAKFDHAYEFLNKNEWLSFDEIEQLARVFVDLGVRKLRITGGEPLLRPHIDELIARLSQIPNVDDLALTTNGAFLTQWAGKLRQAGLKRLTVSLDSLDPETFSLLSGRRGTVEDVLQGIKAAEAAGFEKIKINAVIKRGVNEGGVLDLLKYFRGTKHTVRFIEYMDVGNQNRWDISQVVPSSELIAMIHKHFPLGFIKGTKGGDTAEQYRFLDGQGEVGFISSVTKAFCGTCNRLRLSADGKMYTCLFAAHGTDLREHVRNNAPDDLLKTLISVVWQRREDRYSEQRAHLTHAETKNRKVEMYHIGG